MSRLPRALTFFLLTFSLVLAVVQPVASQARAAAPWVAFDSLAFAAPADAQPGPIVRQSFDLLMDRFVIAPDSGAVLNGGLDGGEQLLQSKGLGYALSQRPEWTNRRNADWPLFLSAYDVIAQKAGTAIPREELDRATVAGMAQSFHENHTYYMPPDAFRDVLAQLNNRQRFAGIGVTMDGERKVLEVFDGSPAEAAGVKVGDQLVAVGDESVDGLTPAETSVKVRGEAGTAVTLTVRRGDGDQRITFTITRAEIQVNWVTARILDGNVGYLRIRAFPGPESIALFRQAMNRFSAANVDGLVIDLRGNAGGSVDTGREVASWFMADNTPLYQQTDRRGSERTVLTWGEHWDHDVPIAVLADGGSGSMAEILAAALQETGVGKVFGVKTAGAVAATNYHPLSDGSGLSVTMLLIKSGQGRTLDVVGLQPDQVVELDTEQLRRGHDNQLEAALTYVRQEIAARTAGPAASTPAR